MLAAIGGSPVPSRFGGAATRENMSEQTRAAPADITRLLRAWRAGSDDALGELVPLVYQELQAIARRHLARENPGHTLTTTALVHEAYLDLLNQASVAG